MIKKKKEEEDHKNNNNDSKKVIFNVVSSSSSLKRVKEIPFEVKSDSVLCHSTALGRHFVPETAFRLLTQESVVTKRGSVITPITLDNNHYNEGIKKKIKKKNVKKQT